MTAFATVLQAFFTDRLMTQRQASSNTIAAYRDTFRLLLGFAADHAAKRPSALDLGDLDAPFIAAFLDHLEHERGNSIRTRNARLAAIHSLFNYAALRHPEHAASIKRVLAIHPSITNATCSPTSPTLKPMRSWPLATAPLGSDDATTPCSSSPCRPGCVSPN
jgi:integrase